MSLEDCITHAAGIGALGIEIVPKQPIPGFRIASVVPARSKSATMLHQQEIAGSGNSWGGHAANLNNGRG